MCTPVQCSREKISSLSAPETTFNRPEGGRLGQLVVTT